MLSLVNLRLPDASVPLPAGDDRFAAAVAGGDAASLSLTNLVEALLQDFFQELWFRAVVLTKHGTGHHHGDAEYEQSSTDKIKRVRKNHSEHPTLPGHEVQTDHLTVHLYFNRKGRKHRVKAISS